MEIYKKVYREKKAEIKMLLTELNKKIADKKCKNWGSVGDLNYILSQLKEINV